MERLNRTKILSNWPLEDRASKRLIVIFFFFRFVMEEILDIDSGVSMSPIAPFYANYLIFFYTRYAAMNPNTRSLIST